MTDLKNMKTWQKVLIGIGAVVIPGSLIIAGFYGAKKLYNNYQAKKDEEVKK
jgi:hypothetical protein